MSSANHPLPPIPQESGGTVRRHHTITASSRTARAQAKDIISEETSSEQALWNDDELVTEGWVGGVGAVGEKTSLHRQSSLPSHYHRGFNASKGLPPKPPLNSLAAIAGHEGDEEPWNLSEPLAQDDEHNPVEQEQQIGAGSAISTHYGQQQQQSSATPSPPPAGSGVRRHVSLTYGAAVGGQRKISTGLKRSGTMQATVPAHSQGPSTPDPAEYSKEGEYPYDVDDLNSNAAVASADDEYYLRQQQQVSSAIGRQSPWSQGDWRAPGNPNLNASNNATIDEVSRALSALEVAGSGGAASYNSNAYNTAHSQSAYPPRFAGNSRGGNGASGNVINSGTNYDGGRRTPNSGRVQNNQNWDQGQPHLVQNRRSNSNLQYGYQQGSNNGYGKDGNGGNRSGAIPAVPPIPQQYLQQQQTQQQGRPGLGVSTNFSNNNSGSQPFVSTPIDVPSLIASKGYNPPTFDIRPAFARFFVIKSYTEDDVHKSLKYEIWSSTDPGNKRLDKAFKETAGRGPIYLFFSVNASGHFCGMAEMLTPVDYTRSSTVWASDKWKGVFKVRWIFVRDIPNAGLRHIKLNNTQERKPVTNSRDTQELLPDAGQEMLRIFHTHPARTSLLQDFAFYELQAMQKMQAQAAAGNPPPSLPIIPTIPNVSSGSSNAGASSPPMQPGSQVHSPQPSHASISSTSTSSSPHGAQNPNSAYQNAYMGNMSPMMMQMQMGMGMGGMGMGGPMNGMGMGMGGMGGMGMNSMGMGMGGMGGMGGLSSNAYQAVMRHSSPGPQQGHNHQGGQQGYNY